MKTVERKKPFLFIATGLVIVFLLIFSFASLPQENFSSCRSCHIRSTPKIAKAWEDSPHYGKVSCDLCHEGEPQETEKEEAHWQLRLPDPEGRIILCASCHFEQREHYATSSHQRSLSSSLEVNPSLFSGGVSLDKITRGEQPLTGPECTTCHGVHNVLTTSNPEAPTYLRRVSELCGLVCHQSDYSQFVQSDHFQALKEEREAPSCITCHTAHADRVVATPKLTRVCAKCHSSATGVAPQAPQQMQDILTLASLGQNFSFTTKKRVDELKREGWDTSRAEVHLNEVRQRFESIPLHWHSFNQQVLHNDLQWILDTLNATERELRELRLIWWVVIGIALVWAFISFLTWIAYIRSRKTGILLLASGFSLLFTSMFLQSELFRNIFQVAGAVVIASGAILPEISTFFQTKKSPSRESKP